MCTVVSVYIVKNNCLQLSTLFSKESIFDIENEIPILLINYHGGINVSQSYFLFAVCSGQLVVNLLMLQVKIRNT